MSYLRLGMDVDEDEFIIADYTLESELPLEVAAEKLAAEESTGTWTKITTTSDEIIEKLGAKVFHIDKSRNFVKIAYPLDDFSWDIGGIPQFLSVVAGNFFGLSQLKNARLVDIHLPRKVIKLFKGPQFGLKKLKQIMNCENIPSSGGTVKPKIGLPPKKYGEFIYTIGIGGLTAGKDDETVVNQSFCPLVDRVIAIREAIDKVKDETGQQMLYSTNVTTRVDKIVEAAELAIEHGANQLLVDVIVAGFSAVQALVDDPSINVPIHCHRAMHAAFTRNPRHGISMKVIAKLCRLVGGDILHVGTWGVGKMHGSDAQSKELAKVITEDFGHLKPMLPIASGGLHPGSVELLIKRAGVDIQVQAGGGIAGHPNGILAGAKALRQAIDAAVKKIPVEKYAETHEELKIAIEHWGVVK
ncbi:MAG: RuBisCO large subunit C-terminal-like domain-containing protein [Candidatus Odinarchaeia archaeon]